MYICMYVYIWNAAARRLDGRVRAIRVKPPVRNGYILCMYVCMCVCMYVYMYVCVYI